MSTKQGLLNETADTSKVATFEVDSTYSNLSGKKSDKTNGTFSVGESRKGGLMIVHPNYSQSPSKAFHGQGSQYYPINQKLNLGAFSKTSYIPPQQYGGRLDDLLSKDTQFKVQMTENELDTTFFACYKYWIVALIPFSLLLSIGMLWFISNPFHYVPTTFIILASILAFWNAMQCIFAYIAIKTKSITKAEKTVILFSVYLTILFFYSVGFCVVVEPKYVMTSVSYEYKIPTAILSGFVIPVLFYFTTVSGAVKAYHILRKRQALIRSLETTLQSTPEL